MPEADPQVFEWTWCLLPVIAAVIGWGTNHLAVRMLFHPRQERRILGSSKSIQTIPLVRSTL